ncbi:MAG: enoyl-CoA hydratase/isomerase family protein, partial [Ottowia sp.]|nr:enoyl-CoA hydratase/isomerase family protein [Ottowia sp.]
MARVTLVNPGKLNVMTRTMWRELRKVFTTLARSADVRCVVVAGEGASFCAGGDIAEYPDFRFEPGSLRDFHEEDVWGGLAAMLACDVPMIAAIEGHCMGGGMEIASCCDIRVAAEHTQFGAPIARLGFP